MYECMHVLEKYDVYDDRCNFVCVGDLGLTL